MAERYEYPAVFTGPAEEQIAQIRRFLYHLVDVLNGNQQTTDANLVAYVSGQAAALRKITGQNEYSTVTTEDIQTQAAELQALLTKALEELQKIQRLSGYVTTTSFPNLFLQCARETEITPATGTGSFYLASDFLTEQEYVDQLQEDMGYTLEDVYNLQTAMTTAQGDITGLQTDMLGAQGNISDLQTDVGKKEAAEAAETELTDADDITDVGKYVITADSTTQSNFPSTITDGDKFLMEVQGIAETFIIQKITMPAEIFIRQYDFTTWGDWYSYTGTAMV